MLKIHIYKVEEAQDTGILKFFSYHDNKAGFYEHVSICIYSFKKSIFRLHYFLVIFIHFHSFSLWGNLRGNCRYVKFSYCYKRGSQEREVIWLFGLHQIFIHREFQEFTIQNLWNHKNVVLSKKYFICDFITTLPYKPVWREHR